MRRKPLVRRRVVQKPRIYSPSKLERVFGGRRYDFARNTATLQQAKQIAVSARRAGAFVRVIKNPKGYGIWINPGRRP